MSALNGHYIDVNPIVGDSMLILVQNECDFMGYMGILDEKGCFWITQDIKEVAGQRCFKTYLL